MPDQSRESNMLACLLATLAPGSFARFHCDVFLFFFLHHVFHFLYKLKEKGSLRCSFYFHVENHRATADASNERSLSASRDIRSIRIAITIQSQ